MDFASNHLVVAAAGVALAILLLLILLRRACTDCSRGENIPTIEGNGILGPYVGAVKFLFDSPGIIRQGCDTYKGRTFRVPELTHWTVVIGPSLVGEYLQLPDKKASLQEAVNEMLQAEYTIGRTVISNPFHIPLVRKLARELDGFVPSVHEELVHAIDHGLLPSAGEWIPITGFTFILRAICQASNRVFVGSPLCRDERFTNLCVGYSEEVVKVAAVLNMLPVWLKPFAARCFGIRRYHREAATLLKPLIEERRAAQEGTKRNDILQWLVDRASAEESDTESLARRVLTLSFAALHTTTLTFTHALYHIAANPAYAEALREELRTLQPHTEWTRAALNGLPRMNSLLKETQRFEGLGCLFLARKAREAFTFSDETAIPKGTFMAVAGTAVHYDANAFNDPTVFNPWRFVPNSGNGMGSASRKFKDDRDATHPAAVDITQTSPTHLAFGHGHTACPGRFFAALEMQLLLAHLVTNYDIRFAGDGRRPANRWFSIHCVPDPGAKLLFRRRSH
ncbi:cytochrome P450 [Schizophyllum commune H4-8]|uniref:Cytochrome P450 n=1 Tax=Schizophyllum commune (strain H4-8 / FGSC 9210) TaxID=578458 RepID=D8Q874_SCHCM|nr:cytochrome P450 [Schizophyllum commune H4-8]KAI5891180.1 cytochrome P450 [Schizophyllum commune H4-8]